MSTENVALHWGSDGIETVTDPKRARELYRSADTHKSVWGEDSNDHSYDVGGGDFKVKFHPGRDYQWTGGAKSEARREWAGLCAAGLPLRSKLFMGEDAHVHGDLDMLWDMVDSGYKGRGASWLFDNAPNLYIAQETIKQTGEILREDFIEMSARSLLPSVTHNTWMDVYRYDRLASKLNGVAQPVSLGGITERGVRKGGSFQRAPVHKGLEFFESGASWESYELERHAEARSNGAPAIDIIREELDMARLQQELVYNFASLFSYPQTGVVGLIPQLVTLGRNVGAAQKLGANANPEEDLAIFVSNFTEMIISSVRTEKPDTIALGTAAWIYINVTDYKSIDSDSTDTLAQTIMRKLGPLGLKDLVWAPEMDYRSEQALSWQNDIGLSPALATQWAGGLNQENIMLMFAKNAEAGRMNIGKDIAARPQQMVGERTCVLYLQSLGEYDVRREKAYRLVTNIGPA